MSRSTRGRFGSIDSRRARAAHANLSPSAVLGTTRRRTIAPGPVPGHEASPEPEPTMLPKPTLDRPCLEYGWLRADRHQSGHRDRAVRPRESSRSPVREPERNPVSPRGRNLRGGTPPYRGRLERVPLAGLTPTDNPTENAVGSSILSFGNPVPRHYHSVFKSRRSRPSRRAAVWQRTSEAKAGLSRFDRTERGERHPGSGERSAPRAAIAGVIVATRRCDKHFGGDHGNVAAPRVLGSMCRAGRPRSGPRQDPTNALGAGRLAYLAGHGDSGVASDRVSSV